MAEWNEYTQVLKMSRVEIEQLRMYMSIARQAHEQQLSEDTIMNKLDRWVSEAGGKEVIKLIYGPKTLPSIAKSVFIMLVSSALGPDYYLDMLKRGESDLYLLEKWAQQRKSKYKYFQFEAAFIRYRGNPDTILVQGTGPITRAQKHDGTWVNV